LTSLLFLCSSLADFWLMCRLGTSSGGDGQSLWDVQVQHMGELTFPILCRYFLSGMWPILSCMSMGACLQDRHSEYFSNLGDGVEGLISCRWGNLDDFMNCLAASDLVSLVWFCLAVDQLVFISSLHLGGNWSSGLVSHLAAFFGFFICSFIYSFMMSRMGFLT